MAVNTTTISFPTVDSPYIDGYTIQILGGDTSIYLTDTIQHNLSNPTTEYVTTTLENGALTYKAQVRSECKSTIGTSSSWSEPLDIVTPPAGLISQIKFKLRNITTSSLASGNQFYIRRSTNILFNAIGTESSARCVVTENEPNFSNLRWSGGFIDSTATLNISAGDNKILIGTNANFNTTNAWFLVELNDVKIGVIQGTTTSNLLDVSSIINLPDYYSTNNVISLTRFDICSHPQVNDIKTFYDVGEITC